MARSWTRDQQRRYNEKRQQQANLVAERLLGRKKANPISIGEDLREALKQNLTTDKLQLITEKIKRYAMESKIQFVMAHEPGEAARKRREEEERRG